jgi:hypothetical protein
VKARPNPPFTFPVFMTRGDDFSFEVLITKDGGPYPIGPLTGISFVAKSSLGDRDNQAIRKTLGYGIQVVNLTTARVRITLSPSDTLALPNITHTYPFELKLADAPNAYTLYSGELKVNASVMQGGIV